MDTDMLRRIDDHLTYGDTGNRLLGLNMLCGTYERDFIFQEQIYLSQLRYDWPYPVESGVN